MSKPEENAKVPTRPIRVAVDPRLDVVAQLPGVQGQKLYNAVRKLAEVSAKSMDDAVHNLLAKYELPADLDGLKEQGYEIVIDNEPPRSDGKQKRSVILYKIVERVEVPTPEVKI